MPINKRLLLFTDLDGTLLDHDSYAPDAALPALRLAQQHDIPIVFCSSKTRAEIEVLRQTLNVHDPFIVENGGALYVPVDYFPFPLPGSLRRDGYDVLELGTPYTQLVNSFRLLRSHLSYRLAGFSDLTDEEVAVICKLPLEAARRAKAREYDEPFRLMTPTPEAATAVRQEIEKTGLQYSNGGRFWHLHGANDKGLAVKLLTAFYRQAWGSLLTVGLGDSLNDAPLLAAVDWPVLVQKPNGAYETGLAQQITGLYFAPDSGPRGWNLAVRQLLYEHLANASTPPPARTLRTARARGSETVSSL